MAHALRLVLVPDRMGTTKRTLLLFLTLLLLAVLQLSGTALLLILFAVLTVLARNTQQMELLTPTLAPQVS